MRATRSGGAMADDAVASCQGDAILAVVEQSQVVPQFAQHLLGIRSQAAEEVGDGQNASHADHRGSQVDAGRLSFAYQVAPVVRLLTSVKGDPRIWRE